MSGSDPSVRRTQSCGSGGSVGGGTDGDDANACPGRPFDTVLGSPFPDVVATLDEGELLDLAAIEEPIRGVMARTLAGEDVGAITRDIRFLRNCMSQGYGYEAEVLRIAGGSVTVRVRGKDTI